MTQAQLKREFPNFPGMWALYKFLADREDTGLPQKPLLAHGYFDYGRNGTSVLDALVAEAREIKGYGDGAEYRFNDYCRLAAYLLTNWEVGAESPAKKPVEREPDTRTSDIEYPV